MMAEAKFVVLDCPYCQTLTRSEVAGTVESFGGPEDQSVRVTLAQCPGCRYPLVGYQHDEAIDEYGNEGWSDFKRIWPRPDASLSSSIPPKIAASLSEAQKCLAATAYTASVAMTGRALEAIGRHFHTNGKADRLMLAAGLDELHDKEIIDNRLYTWGKALHENRNLAAHASDRIFDRHDAQDLLNFAIAICEYVFVLAERFAEFQKRQAAKKTPKATGFSGDET
jgi:Domain of unknown function (DUF4145)